MDLYGSSIAFANRSFDHSLSAHLIAPAGLVEHVSCASLVSIKYLAKESLRSCLNNQYQAIFGHFQEVLSCFYCCLLRTCGISIALAIHSLEGISIAFAIRSVDPALGLRYAGLGVSTHLQDLYRAR